MPKFYYTLPIILCVAPYSMAGGEVGLRVGFPVGRAVGEVVGSILPAAVGGALPLEFGGIAAIAGLSLIIGTQLIKRKK